MAGLFEQMAVSSRDVACGRVKRPYKVTVSVGHTSKNVDAWAVNACDAIRAALANENFDGQNARVSARLVG